MIEIQPTGDKPLPFDLSDEQPKTHADSISQISKNATFLYLAVRLVLMLLAVFKKVIRGKLF